jgi:5-methyltetrahydropteroyltriglutamate--homocysteine methyltransferase
MTEEGGAMSAKPVARAETVGSLLKPEWLLEAQRRFREGLITREELRPIEDRAVLEAIALQESVGLDVITDGEMRRFSWADTVRHLEGLELRQVPRSYPATAAGDRIGRGGDRAFLTVVRKVIPRPEPMLGWEYSFLRTHARSRTKFTMAAPSYHRRFWSDHLSRAAYGRCEEFLIDVRNWLHEVAKRLVAEGCTYLQLDAPNYGSLCDPVTRAFHTQMGHDLDREIEFDARLDSSVFDGLEVTRALHVCRGNLPGGTWHSSGGYGAIAEQLFPNLDVDVLLLEYDSERSGDFTPLRLVRPGTTVVLGLITTKDGRLEEPSEIEARIQEASAQKSLAELALSTQCGFASAANAPMSEEEQHAKLGLVAHLAHRIWR